MTLLVNRYGVTAPTQILESGISISTPIYIAIPVETAKTLINAFRVKKQKELLEMGYENHYQSNSVSVTTNNLPKMCPIETEIGMDENALRATLFGRTGVSERLLLKLQSLVDLEIVSKEQIEDTQKQWLQHLFPNATKGTTRTRKTSKKAEA